MDFQFIVKPDDESFERMNGCVEANFLPRIGESQRFYFPGGCVTSKVTDVQHMYMSDRPQGPLVIMAPISRADFDAMANAYHRRTGWHITDDAL